MPVNLTALPKLRDRILQRMANVDAAREDMKEIYLSAKDKQFHIKALKLTIRLYKMEPAERNDFLSSLNAYCDAIGITGQADLLGETPTVPQPAQPTANTPAWEGGRLAALEGKDATNNPWPMTDLRYKDWRGGYASVLVDIEPSELDEAYIQSACAVLAPILGRGSAIASALNGDLVAGEPARLHLVVEEEASPRRRGRPRKAASDLPPAA
jgi:uncharacterized protein (UPF0335 family)